MSITKARRYARHLEKAIEKGLGHHALRQRGQRLIDAVFEIEVIVEVPETCEPFPETVMTYPKRFNK